MRALVLALALGAIADPIQKRSPLPAITNRVLGYEGFPKICECSSIESSSKVTSFSKLTPELVHMTTYATDPCPLASSQVPDASISVGIHKSGEIQATFSSGPDYQAAVLFHHNIARTNHGAPPLSWDDDCETNAMKAAKQCLFHHYMPQHVSQGQNLFTVSGNFFNVTAGITESWYKGELETMEPYWGKKNIPSDVSQEVGHLTQLLWKSTTKIGCVSFDCGSSMKMENGQSTDMNKFTVCNYARPGNVMGAYDRNVAAPISTHNLGSWLD